MKNYEELLKDIGIDIPDDKKESFGKSFNENYKTVAEVEKIKTKLENSTSDNSNLTERLEQSQKDITELKEKLEASGEDATKIKELQTEVENLLKKNEEQSKQFAEAEKQREYLASVKDAMKDLKFSSKSAEQTFISKAVEKQFASDNGKLLGFDEFVKDYKENDSGAFVEKADVTLGGKSEKLGEESPKSSKKHAF